MTEAEARALDREIHGRVFRLATLRNMAGYENIPRYSTDIRAAWQVVEKRCEDNWRFTLRNVLGTQWECQLWRGLEEEAEAHFVETAPLAICQCALAALLAAPGGREGGENAGE